MLAHSIVKAFQNGSADAESRGDFATVEGARTYITEVMSLVDPGTAYATDPCLWGDRLTVSLTIENGYELYDDVTTRVVDALITPPPADVDSDEYQDWEQTQIIRWTGVGHTTGDSWYDVTVTACSDPALIGKAFSFGY